MTRSRAPLAGLADYAIAARSQLNKRNSSDVAKRWLAYSSAIGSALALSGSAAADIIYSGPQNLSVSVNKGGSSSPRRSFFINPNLKQTLDLNNFTGGGSFGTFAALRNGSHVYVPGHNNYVRRLASGQVISAGIPGGFRGNAGSLRGAFVSGSGAYFQLGDWPATGVGFAGFRYYDPSKKLHYGWIRLSLEGVGGANPAPQATLAAIDWAYQNTPDTAIAAGDIGAAGVPEPSSLALMALATGAAGVYALRRRRASRAAQASTNAEHDH